MTEKEGVEKLKGIKGGVEILKSLFSKFNEDAVKLSEVKLKDGSTLVVEGDSAIVGASVLVVTDGGNVPAPDGEYELEDGSIIVIGSGKIAEVKEAAKEEKKDEVPMASDVDAKIVSLIERIEKLEGGLKLSEERVLEASKVIESQKAELKKQFKIQEETFKLVELMAEMPATKGVEKVEKIDSSKVDRIAMLSNSIKSLKQSK